MQKLNVVSHTCVMLTLAEGTLLKAAAAAMIAFSTEELCAEAEEPPTKARNTCTSPSGGGAGVVEGVRAAVMAAVPEAVLVGVMLMG